MSARSLPGPCPKLRASAACTSTFQQNEYLKVPFRLAQAPAYFQELMKKVLKDLPFTIAYCIMKEHLDHLQKVFHKLQNGKLSMNVSKCHFFTREIQYLGNILSATHVKPLPSKLEAIKIC